MLDIFFGEYFLGGGCGGDIMKSVADSHGPVLSYASIIALNCADNDIPRIKKKKCRHTSANLDLPKRIKKTTRLSSSKPTMSITNRITTTSKSPNGKVSKELINLNFSN